MMRSVRACVVWPQVRECAFCERLDSLYAHSLLEAKRAGYVCLYEDVRVGVVRMWRRRDAHAAQNDRSGLSS